MVLLIQNHSDQIGADKKIIFTALKLKFGEIKAVSFKNGF